MSAGPFLGAEKREGGREEGALYYSFPPLPLVAAAFESGGRDWQAAWEGFRKEKNIWCTRGKARLQRKLHFKSFVFFGEQKCS